MRRLLALCLALCACARVPLIAPQPLRDRATVFRSVRVFDGRSEALSRPTDVVVRDGRIAAIGPGLEAPEGAETVRGGVLLPGLWDSHVHLGGVEGEPVWDLGKRLPDGRAQAAAHLYCGTTTAVIAGDNGDTYRVARDIEENREAGPRLLTATRIFTARGGHPAPMDHAAAPAPIAAIMLTRTVVEVTGEAELRAALRQELTAGAHHVKIVYHQLPPGAPTFSLDELKAAIDESRKLGKPVYVHVGTAQGAVEAAQAGAALLMHVPWEDELSPEQVQAIAKAGTPVVTTRRIYAAWLNALSGDPKLTKLEKKVMRPGLEEILKAKPEQISLFGWEDYLGRAAEFDRILGVNVKALHEGGVTLLAGTDTGLSGVFPGAGLHEELKSIAALGIPAAAVLKMATSNPARVVEPEAKRGVIEVGAIADLLLIEDDPLQNLEALDEIEGVWKAGQRQR